MLDLVVDTSAPPVPDRSVAAALARRLAARTATVAVVGLGHVGLPLALATARAGFRTVGLDSDPARIARLSDGDSPLRHVPAAALRRALLNGSFRPGVEADLAEGTRY